MCVCRCCVCVRVCSVQLAFTFTHNSLCQLSVVSGSDSVCLRDSVLCFISVYTLCARRCALCRRPAGPRAAHAHHTPRGPPTAHRPPPPPGVRPLPLPARGPGPGLAPGPAHIASHNRNAKRQRQYATCTVVNTDREHETLRRQMQELAAALGPASASSCALTPHTGVHHGAALVLDLAAWAQWRS
jgi:hypothetical protein